jgi:hypothetical protein
VLEALRKSPATFGRRRWQQALSLSLSLCVVQNADHGDGEARQDDRKRAVRPAPVVGVELGRSSWSSICGDDVRRGGESVSETTVLEGGSVGGYDIDGERHAGETDAVEDLRRTVDADAVAAGSKDQTQSREARHESETDPAIPQVEDLGKRHVCRCSHDARYDTDERHQRVGFEFTRDEWRKVAGDRLVESIDEVQQPHPACVSERKRESPVDTVYSQDVSYAERLLRPSKSDTLHGLDTILGVLVGHFIAARTVDGTCNALCVGRILSI